jgi:hypothetical protein
MTTDERRSHQRFSVWFPVTVEQSSERVWAICRDASGGGVLISATSPLTIGATVELKFRLSATEPDRIFPATVLRMLDNDDELLLAFPFRIALEFKERDDSFPDELNRRAEIRRIESSPTLPRS